MRIDRHVFGSRVGYTTLAYSESLSTSDCRKLETFGFGQTSDRGYLNSLANTPAYISRPLDQTRRAITRVLLGQPDDAGRNTLLLVSAILSNSEWIRVLRGDVLPLLDNPGLWQWDGQTKISSINVSISSPHPLSLGGDEAKEIVGLISEIERLYSSGRNVVISEPKYSLTTVRAIEMLIPDSAKPGFSCSARSLSTSLGVNLNCVARGVGINTVSPNSQIYKPQTDGILSPYATELVRGRIMQGLIPDYAVRSYRGFGAIAEEVAVAQSLGLDPETAGAADASRKLKTRRDPMSFAKKAIIGLAAFALIAFSILGYGIYRKTTAEARRKDNAAKAEILLKIRPLDFALKSEEQRKTDLDTADRVAREIGNDPYALEEARTNAGNLLGWRQRMDEIDKDLKKYNDQILTSERSLPAIPFSNQLPESVEDIKNKITAVLASAGNLKSTPISKNGEINLSNTSIGPRITELENRANEALNAITQYEQSIRKKKLDEIQERLMLLYGDLTSGNTALVAKAFERFDSVMADSRNFAGDLKLDIEKVQSAKLKAISETEASKMGKEIVVLMQQYLSDKSGEKELDQKIAKLKESDAPYAQALEKIFEALKKS